MRITATGAPSRSGFNAHRWNKNYVGFVGFIYKMLEYENPVGFFYKRFVGKSDFWNDKNWTRIFLFLKRDP
jgi:hypothetical protein